jgi:DNA-binding beta-propeller fold protein YncE
MSSIFISDRGRHQIINIPEINGKPAAKTLGAEGSGVKQFNQPAGIFVDQALRIYVADMDNHRVVRTDDMSGKNWTTLGSKGSNPKQFDQPAGVHLDAKNRLYVADMNNHRIVRMDDLTGKNWTTFGTKGKVQSNDPAKLKFYRPTGVFVDSQQRIYIADMGNSRIVRIDDMTGKGWTTFGSIGTGTKQFTGPTKVVVDQANRIYVTDFGNRRVVTFDDMTGKNWSPTVNGGASKLSLLAPTGISLQTTGGVFVADMSSHIISQLNFTAGKGWTVSGQQGQFFVGLKIPGKKGPLTSLTGKAFKNPYDIHQA